MSGRESTAQVIAIERLLIDGHTLENNHLVSGQIYEIEINI